MKYMRQNKINLILVTKSQKKDRTEFGQNLAKKPLHFVNVLISVT